VFSSAYSVEMSSLRLQSLSARGIVPFLYGAIARPRGSPSALIHFRQDFTVFRTSVTQIRRTFFLKDNRAPILTGSHHSFFIKFFFFETRCTPPPPPPSNGLFLSSLCEFEGCT